MLFKRGIFWSVVAVVEAGLVLWILSLVVLRPKPEPVILGQAVVPRLKDRSHMVAVSPPAQESAS